jgi:hypothetical protein
MNDTGRPDTSDRRTFCQSSSDVFSTSAQPCRYGFGAIAAAAVPPPSAAAAPPSSKR